MKVLQKSINVYKLEYGDEKTELALFAIDKYRYINVDSNFIFDSIIDNFIEFMELLGIYVKKNEVYYSGFYSQGDGASFECYVDVIDFFKNNGNEHDIMNALKIESHPFCNNDSKIMDIVDNLLDTYKKFPKLLIHINRYVGHYYHSETMYVDSYDYDDEDNNQISNSDIENASKEILSYLKEFAGILYKKLEDDYNYFTSDECVFETLVENEYMFDDDGRIVE